MRVMVYKGNTIVNDGIFDQLDDVIKHFNLYDIEHKLEAQRQNSIKLGLQTFSYSIDDFLYQISVE